MSHFREFLVAMVMILPIVGSTQEVGKPLVTHRQLLSGLLHFNEALYSGEIIANVECISRISIRFTHCYTVNPIPYTLTPLTLNYSLDLSTFDRQKFCRSFRAYMACMENTACQSCTTSDWSVCNPADPLFTAYQDTSICTSGLFQFFHHYGLYIIIFICSTLTIAILSCVTYCAILKFT